MGRTVIGGVRIVQPGVRITEGSVVIEDGRIAALGPTAEPMPPVGAARIEGRGRLLTPGLIDVHTHGIQTHIYEAGPEQLCDGLRAVVRYGTTSVLPTFYTVMGRDTLPHLERLAQALSTPEGAFAPGVHLEGPFLALTGAGASTMCGDVGLLEDILAACGGRVRVMSVSPETPNILPVIERLREHGVRVFITHTQATPEQTRAAIDAGATHATHFYDVFPTPAETDPGVRPVGAMEAVLADPRCTVDFICDGVHVHPMAIKATLAAKGHENVSLITDSIVGAGLPDGVYETPWGYSVKVSPRHAARVYDPHHPRHGALAGSALTMDRGVANLMDWLDLPAEQVWAMGTRNPARVIGLERKGQLEVGADADLVLWDDGFRPAKTWVCGECVYEADG